MEITRFDSIVENSVRRQALSGVTLLVGVSGGADSLALLHSLAKVAKPLTLRLVVAHFDHRLRPESGADARFVEAVAHSLGVVARVGTGEIRTLANERGMGLEEAARYARLRFFTEIACETGAAAVALGHTRDDQTETRLLHLARGTGLRGLVGMEENSLQTIDGRAIRVVRPLLAVGRADTAGYCAALSLQPRVDRTNRELIYARNRVRHTVVPPMRDLNPRLDEALERLGRSARAAEEFVEAELDRRFPDVLIERTTSRWVINRKSFRELPEALKRALVRRAAENLDATVGGEAIETAVAAGDFWPSGSRITWPSGCDIRVEHDALSIGREPVDLSGTVIARPMALPLTGGEAHLRLPPSLGGGERTAEAVLRVRRREKPCPRPWHRWHADLDARRVLGPVGVRGRRPGDRLAVEGSAGTKKLQDILVDVHIPRHERDRVPLLTADDSVAWVVGLRRNRDFLAGPACGDVLCCEVVEKTDDTCAEIC